MPVRLRPAGAQKIDGRTDVGLAVNHVPAAVAVVRRLLEEPAGGEVGAAEPLAGLDADGARDVPADLPHRTGEAVLLLEATLARSRDTGPSFDRFARDLQIFVARGDRLGRRERAPDAAPSTELLDRDERKSADMLDSERRRDLRRPADRDESLAGRRAGAKVPVPPIALLEDRPRPTRLDAANLGECVHGVLVP